MELYKNFGENDVLKGLSLDILDGETITIIGGSGEGKSVLLKHIAGLMKPDKGTVYVDDEDIMRMDEEKLQQVQKKFGFLFQGAALFDSMTVYENVSFGVRRIHSETPEKKIREIVKTRLELVGLEGIEDMKPASLSGGMKKRVALARAIATNPRYILYDEPTTGLDPIRAGSINDLINSMQEKLNVTSIVVTHDMTSAYEVSDRIAMLAGGRIIETGTPGQIQKSPNDIVRKFIRGE